MTFSKKEKDALEEIVIQEGDCLDGYDLCQRCPFRSECLSKFLNRANPTPGHRLTTALDALGNEILEDDDAE
jgi:hypothetical protein